MPRSERAVKPDVFAPPVVKPVPIRDRARDAEYAWLREQGQEYRGQWVVLDGSELVASGPRLREVRQQLTAADRERDSFFFWIEAD